MSSQSQWSSPRTGVIAGAVFVVALVALMIFGYSFWGALFLALAIAVAVAVFLLLARRRSEDDMSAAPTDLSRGWRATTATDASRSAYGAGSVAPDPAAPGGAAALMSAPPAPEPPPAPDGAAAVPLAEVGAEPLRLDAPREGRADDLKRIKGVGPKLEGILHRLGIYHLDQIASWTPAEVAWMDEHLVEFRGRVSRDGWVSQARLLAGGGETEFSRRVDDGDVYH